jgi:segregation and condensation protein B
VSKRKKPNTASPPSAEPEENDSVTTRATVPPDVLERAIGGNPHDEPTAIAMDPRAPLETDPDAGFADAAPDSAPPSESVDIRVDAEEFDAEMTVNLVGDLPLPGRDDLDAPTVSASGDALEELDRLLLQRKHLRGLLEALVFASDGPIKATELAKLAHAPQKQVKELLGELKQDYATRGVHLDEVAGGWVFRTSPQYAPFVRDLTKQRPVRLTRAQVETLAIIAYRQPITRPEVDDVRGVDTGPVLKLLLERDLVRILGKRDEPGRPLIYGTTGHFLEFFGLKSLKDLPTLREFTELSDESRDTFEEELGESPEDAARRTEEAEARVAAGEGGGTGELGEHEPDDRAPHESMRVPVGEHALDDLGADDLEPLSGIEDVAPPHASDDDGPTLTSEAPSTKDD